MAHVAVQTLYVAVLASTFLKVAEMLYHLWRYARITPGRSIRVALALANWKGRKPPEQAVRLLNRYRWTWDRRSWPITGLILRIPLPSRIVKVFAIDVFRWPCQMLLLAAMLVFAAGCPFLAAGAVTLLVLGIWIEIGLRFTGRITLGSLESYFRRNVRHQIRIEALAVRYTKPGQLDVIRDFLFTFLRLAFVVIIGYASIYSSLVQWTGREEFRGIRTGAFRLLWGIGVPVEFMEALYFSMVTTATVGYGDVLPVTLFARGIVGSQIAAGLSLLVLLVTAFSLTPRPDHEVAVAAEPQEAD